jgi:galactarate dehydratase
LCWKKRRNSLKVSRKDEPGGLDMQPSYVRVYPSDNVAVIANAGGVPEGAQFSDGLTALEAIPQANKIALRDFAKGEAFVRYGAVIGFASRPIPKGSWVREDCVTLPDAPELDQMPLATAIPAPQASHQGVNKEG